MRVRASRSLDRQHEGWGVFFHRPYGAFDLRDEEGCLTPDAADATPRLDAFFVVTREPAQIMREYALITGFPPAPALVARLHAIAPYSRRPRAGARRSREFRRRQLPCDAFIYLGTGFTTGGWNTGHGQFPSTRTYFRILPR
jgi:alpha-glucosidase/alpha-D-xyloside xylohydrolase